MLPPERRLGRVLELIEDRKYFTLHAGRQTGKTTSLLWLERHLNATGRFRALARPATASPRGRGEPAQVKEQRGRGALAIHGAQDEAVADLAEVIEYGVLIVDHRGSSYPAVAHRTEGRLSHEGIDLAPASRRAADDRIHVIFIMERLTGPLD